MRLFFCLESPFIMQSFLEYVVKNLVDNPAAVSVEHSLLDGRSLFDIRVGLGDMGKVVGKQGQTIDAIRSVASAAASKYGEQVDIELVEDHPPQRPRPAQTPESA
jgi:predicted RNA-binding protein YlqC (UPF0109 family)